MKVIDKKTGVYLEIVFDEEKEETRFIHPLTSSLCELPEQCFYGWSCGDPEDQKGYDRIASFLDDANSWDILEDYVDQDTNYILEEEK